MNTLTNYGVTLELLTHEKIEMVRQWRNNPKISQYMEFRGEITPDMQDKWFKNIDNCYNLYFIIQYDNIDVGLINIKDLNEAFDEGESGCFIYEDKFLNRDISYRAHIVLYDYFFIKKKGKGLRAHIKDDNTRSTRFSTFLGYKLVSGSTTEYFLSKDDYLNNKNRIRFIKKEKLINNK